MTTNGQQPVTLHAPHNLDAYKALPKDQYRIFIDAIVEGLAPPDAYARAYGAVTRRTAIANASRLLTRADVAAALQEKRAIAARRSEITAEHIVQGILRNALEARAAGQFAASNQAWIALGKQLFGMFADRIDINVARQSIAVLVDTADVPDEARALIMSEAERYLRAGR